MKKALTSLALTSALNLSVFAQNSLTNTFNGKLEIRGPECIGCATYDIAAAYKVRINVEILPIFNHYEADMTVTNATLAQMLEAVMNINTNYVLRYETQTDSYYINPKTNAVSLMKCDQVSITNKPLFELFGEDGVPAFNEIGLGCSVHRANFYVFEVDVSLDVEDMFVWQILDALEAQIPNLKGWGIQEIRPEEVSKEGYRYMVEFNQTRSTGLNPD